MERAIIDLYKSEADITASIYFSDLNLTLSDEIKEESPEIIESILKDKDIKFGACVASQIKLTLIDVSDEITGKEFIYYHHIGDYDVPIGKYIVDSCKKQENKLFSDVIAYDALIKTNVDVATWYNSLFPNGNESYTLAVFRASFLAHVGLEWDSDNIVLPNDSMTVTKTINPTQLSGRTVIECCEELNGAFGRIGRNGKFKHVVLTPGYGLYPSNNLYPSDNLYPVSENDTINSMPADETITDDMFRENGVKFEEYTVKEIDKLIIRQEENDIGAIVGSGDNAYVIQGNFLVYGKSAEELQTIAQNAFAYINKRPYRPYEADCIGLPYLEPGDCLEFVLTNKVRGYMFSRTLTGIQALKDVFEAKGSPEIKQSFDSNNQFIQVQGKMAKIIKSVEQVSVQVSDLDAQLSGEIDVLAGQVVLKVTSSGQVAVVELGADPSTGTTIKLSADNIELEGIVTANGNFKILSDGSMEAVNGKFSGDITGVTLTSFSTDGVMLIDGPYLEAFDPSGESTVSIQPNGSATFTGNVQCNTLNGRTPITTGNISSQSVAYAENADTSDIALISYQLQNQALTGYVYVSQDKNFRPQSDLLGSCGSSAARWTSVWAQSATIQTSDLNKKNIVCKINDDDRYIRFAKMIVPYLYKMKDGQSGRIHAGFIAQYIESAMKECEITDYDFAGLIKEPIYKEKIVDSNGNTIDEYDTTSEIIGYNYGLRYEEFIPLLFLLINS